MAKVLITKSKLDALAQHINDKIGASGAMTIAQMQAAVDDILVGEPYTGEYEVIPKFETQELATKDKQMKDNVKIQAIPVKYADNPQGGQTVTIG